MLSLITRDELEAQLSAGAVVLVDALPSSYYDQQHLPGALNLVEADTDARAAEVLPDKDAAIVTYCSNEACGNSHAVARRLRHLGYTNVRTYREGIQDWVEAGNATESTASTPSATRVVDGTVLPVAGVWDLDPGHTDVSFVGRHFMVTKVRGRLTGVTGAVAVAEDLGDSSVDVVIDMSTVTSGNPSRDEHLRSAELFDVERYPQATFRSTAVEWSGSSGTVHGDLTIHGVTRNVPLAVTFEGHARDPWGGDRAIFSARTEIDREDFGITWNMTLEAGGLLVSKSIRIEIDLETVLRT